MKPSEAKEIKDLLIQTRKEVSEYRADLGRVVTEMPNLVAEEVGHVTKNQADHQQRDDRMFGELKEEQKKTQVNHDEIIRLLQKSADDRKFMGEQINTIVKTVDTHKKIVSRGEGILWFVGIAFTGGIIDLLHRLFGK